MYVLIEYAAVKVSRKEITVLDLKGPENHLTELT